MSSIKKRTNGKWRARYRDEAGKEHAKHFDRKVDAQRWLDEETAGLVSGTWVAPAKRKITVGEWCDSWIEGYGSRRASTVRQAKVHIALIREEFGDVQLSAVRPSMVKSWSARLKADGAAQSYVYRLHGRLSQIMQDAVLDGLIGANPCSKRTSPSSGDQVPYVATTEQVWSLYDAMGERYKVSVLIGAFAGLTTAEACGLRPDDVKFLRREIHPAVLYPAEPLKTEMRRTPVPIADTLVAALSEQVKAWPADTILTYENGTQLGPWQLQREFRRARTKVDGLPEGFRYHDLRHYFASLLISSGADVKIVQYRLRHASAKTTLDTYAHLWPDSDESTRTAVEKVMSAKLAVADPVRTAGRPS